MMGYVKFLKLININNINIYYEIVKISKSQYIKKLIGDFFEFTFPKFGSMIGPRSPNPPLCLSIK
jgi:hypothetical protein